MSIPLARHIVGDGTPGQPARYAAIGAHLARDMAAGRLTLKGPDLGYWLNYATPGDELRDWVLAAIDDRIRAADAARDRTLVGRPWRGDGDPPFLCPVCHGDRAGAGDDLRPTCLTCEGAGVVCPSCRGARHVIDPARPVGHPSRFMPCADCAVQERRPDGSLAVTGVDYDRETHTIRRFVDRMPMGGQP